MHFDLPESDDLLLELLPLLDELLLEPDDFDELLLELLLLWVGATVTSSGSLVGDAVGDAVGVGMGDAVGVGAAVLEQPAKSIAANNAVVMILILHVFIVLYSSFLF